VPTIIRYLHDASGLDPRRVNLSDPKVISLFSSPEALGLTENDCKTGTLGLPEFGTPFVRQMLLDTNPASFSDLVRISGLSHGTDVWFNNAQDLIKRGVATLKEVIPTRDDIMVYLIHKGVESLKAFKIMDSVRKGRGLTGEDEKLMRAKSVPEWYIDSCKKIKYMFPKGHAVAYVMMTARIGYFKIYYPYCFYGATFSVKVEDFDYETMCRGAEAARAELNRIGLLGKNASQKEKNNYAVLELTLEMYARGLKFLPLDLYKSDAKKFLATKNGLLPPLLSIPGLGENVAEAIVNARADGEFLTISDFKKRSKAAKNVIDLLTKLDVFKDLPETDQLTFF
jgi:DNA polymerase-3 subunit alpha (Gram-positive type)